jgi:hypothetical protein
MDIIKSIQDLETNFKNTNTFDFEDYKIKGRLLSQLSTTDQIIVVSFILQHLFENNNFTFYLFILQSYIDNLKIIDSYNTNMISKTLLSSVINIEGYNIVNILKLLESIYPLDYSVICDDNTYLSLLSNYIIKLYNEKDNDNNRNYIDIITYILKRGNYYNENDSINVYIYLSYLEKKYPEIGDIINLKDMIDEKHILNAIKIIQKSSKEDDVLDIIQKYCNENNIDMEILLNSKDKYNKTLLTFCKNYNTFERLYNSNLIHSKNLYKNCALMIHNGVYVSSPMYYIILFKLKTLEDKIKFIDRLGIVEDNYNNKDIVDNHNQEIKKLIKYNFPTIYNNIWNYIL